jgi:hypothetical protein
MSMVMVFRVCDSTSQGDWPGRRACPGKLKQGSAQNFRGERSVLTNDIRSYAQI